MYTKVIKHAYLDLNFVGICGWEEITIPAIEQSSFLQGEINGDKELKLRNILIVDVDLSQQLYFKNIFLTAKEMYMYMY